MMAWTGVAGSSVTVYGRGPRAIATSPGSRRTGSSPSPWISADPRTVEITAIGASSWMRRHHGGSKASLSRNAPRARGPSRSPAMASMVVDDDEWMCAFQLWIVYGCAGSIPSMLMLVTGATGKTGSRIVDRLTVQGVEVRGVSRATGFDWDDHSTWPAALAGVDAAYIAYYPDLTIPGAAELL